GWPDRSLPDLPRARRARDAGAVLRAAQHGAGSDGVHEAPVEEPGLFARLQHLGPRSGDRLRTGWQGEHARRAERVQRVADRLHDDRLLQLDDVRTGRVLGGLLRRRAPDLEQAVRLAVVLA